MASGALQERRAPGGADGRGLRVVLDARLRDGVSGGVQQWVIGLATALGRLDDGPEDYVFLTIEGEDAWLRPFLSGRARFVAIPAAAPAIPAAARTVPAVATRPPERRPRAGRLPLLRRILRRLRRVMRPGSSSRRVPSGAAPSASMARGPEAPASATPSAGHLAITALGADVMHFTNQSGFRTSVPSIYQPWDLQHVHLPDFFTPAQRAGRDRNYRAWIGQAARVVVATTWVKDDIARELEVEPERIVVVNPGPATMAYDPPSPEAEAEIADRLELPEAFLFYPAQTWAHKNHDRLFEALAILRDKGLEIQLLCSGTQTERYGGLVELATALGIGHQVRFLGYVSPAEVQVLYRRARGLVFPSLYEGWGLPILEAFAAGLPVASSSATSLPRLVGDAAIVFDPLDATTIANAIERLWKDEPERNRLIKRGRERAAQFEWEAAARRLRAVYREVAGRELDAADRALLDAPPLV